MFTTQWCLGRFVRTLLIVPISMGLALPAPALALRESQEDSAVDEIAARLTGGLEEPAPPPAATPKKPRTLGLTRRQWFGVMTSLGVGAVGLGTWGYRKFTTDESFPWEPSSEALENVMQLRPVWEPQRLPPEDDALAYLHRLVVDPTAPEMTRRTARDLRFVVRTPVTLRGRLGRDEYDAKRAEWLVFVGRHLPDFVQGLQRSNPARATTFPAQWELIRLRRVLGELFVDYAATAPRTPVPARLLGLAGRELAAPRAFEASDDLFVRYVRQQAGLTMSPRDLLARALRHEQSLAEGLVEHLRAFPATDSARREIEQTLAQAPPLPALNDDQRRAYDRVINDLTTWSDLFPTREAFEGAARYYQALTQGPIRPIAIEDLAVVAYARRELLADRPHFLDSGQAHGMPSDILAAVALLNVLRKAYRPYYPLGHGFSVAVGQRSEAAQERVDHLERILPKAVKNVRFQDRLTDWAAGRLVGGVPTIGPLQIRAYQVQDEGLWRRWLSDAEIKKWPTRKINKWLLDRRWGIEAGTVWLRRQLDREIVAQRDGQSPTLPEVMPLAVLAQNQWLAMEHDPIRGFLGPDPILAHYASRHMIGVLNLTWLDLENGVLRWVDRDPPFMRMLVHKAGLTDAIPGQIPAKVVGLRNEADVEVLFGWARHKDPYLRDAALRSLRELAEQQDFPHRRQVQGWLQRHAPRGGLEERGRAMARDVAVAAWRGVERMAGLEASARSSVLVFTHDLDLATLAVQQGLAVAVPVDGPEAAGLEELLGRLGPKGPYAIGTLASARFLQEHAETRQILITSRQRFFALVGLEEDRLLAPVRQALTATRDFLDLAA